MYRKFCVTMIGLTVVLLLLAGAVNVVVDPYGIWGLFRQVGFNMSSPQTENTEQLLKPIDFLRHGQPEAIFLGNSQVMYAMDMDTYHEMSGYTGYNFGVRGGTPYEMRRFLEHVLATDSQLREVYVGVGFEMFIQGEYFGTEYAHRTFLETEEQLGQSHVILPTWGRAVFSWLALQDSKQKVRANYLHRWEHPRYARGKACEDSLLEFNEREQRRFNHTLVGLQMRNAYHAVWLDDERTEEMRHIAELCREHGIGLTFFIPATHARHLEVLADCWDIYEEWKRQMVEIAPVWDFSGYNDLTMSEAAEGPVRSDTNPWFWDVMHGKAVLGDLMMARMLDRWEARQDFGQRLSSENLEIHLAEMRQGLIDWERKHPESVEEVRYYAGFSPIEPRALHGCTYLPESLPVQVESALGGMFSWYGKQIKVQRACNRENGVFSLELSQDWQLDIRGARIAPTGAGETMYVMLDDGAGSRLFAMAQPVASPEAEKFMRNKNYGECGFRARLPLRNVPAGTYRVSLMQRDKAEMLCKTAPLGQLTVKGTEDFENACLPLP